jgi:MarR family multiple antibiotic resistance transcriptional regulator
MKAADRVLMQDASFAALPIQQQTGMRDLLLSVERLHRTLQNAIEDLLVPHDLSLTQWLILSGVVEGSGSTLTHFARLLNRDAGSLSRAIYQLTRRGLVNHRRNPRDRRSTRLVVSEAGYHIHADVAPQIASMLADLDRGNPGNGHAVMSPVLDELALRVQQCRSGEDMA